MKKNIIILTAIGFLSACTHQIPMKEVKSLQDADKFDGQEISVTGIYTASVISQKKDYPSSSTGQYKITVNDSLSVLLLPPYKAESKRPKEEIAEMEGKEVKVTGVLSRKTYMEAPSIENEPLSVSIPCFTEIKKIELLK